MRLRWVWRAPNKCPTLRNFWSLRFAPFDACWALLGAPNKSVQELGALSVLIALLGALGTVAVTVLLSAPNNFAVVRGAPNIAILNRRRE